MNIHKNARLTPLRREEMVLAVIEGGFPRPKRRGQFGVSAKIVAQMGRALQGGGRAKAWPTVRHGPTSCQA